MPWNCPAAVVTLRKTGHMSGDSLLRQHFLNLGKSLGVVTNPEFALTLPY